MEKKYCTCKNRNMICTQHGVAPEISGNDLLLPSSHPHESTITQGGTTKVTPEDWEAAFERKCVGSFNGERIAFVPLTKAFIRTLLTSQRTELAEIISKLEKLYGSPYTVEQRENQMHWQGYNEALEHVLKLLQP